MSCSLKVGILALQGDFAEHMGTVVRMGATAIAVRTVSDLDGIHGLIIPGGESTTMRILLNDKLKTLPSLKERIERFINAGYPVWGTCAGAIILCQRILADEKGGKRVGESSSVKAGSSVPDEPKLYDPPVIPAVSATIRRNCFGRQTESFEGELEFDSKLSTIDTLFRFPASKDGGSKLSSCFIRAPAIVEWDVKHVHPVCWIESDPKNKGPSSPIKLPSSPSKQVKAERTLVAACTQNVLITCFHPELSDKGESVFHRVFLDACRKCLEEASEPESF